MPRLHSTLLTVAGLVLALTTAAAAQEYPNKPVRLIIPFPPGGSNDVVGRLIATHLGDRLGKRWWSTIAAPAQAASSDRRLPPTHPMTATRC